MVDVVFAVPGSLDTPTGGYAYDRRVIAELSALGCRPHVINLGEGFPFPAPTIRSAASTQLTDPRCDFPLIVDGLALGVLPEAAAAASKTRPLIALVHHPLALETGLSDEQANRLRQSERAALSHARHVIVTSAATARTLAADYDVPDDRISIALPGMEIAPAAIPRTGTRDTLNLLSVGSLVPRKGYDTLVAALSDLKELRWHLTIVGDDSRSPQTSDALRMQIARAGLGERITLAGPVSSDRLQDFYDDADIFVLPSRFEGYGMAYAEALARGVPVIGTTAGAIPDTVPSTAGILVMPDDITALAGALRLLMMDTRLRADFAAGAAAAGARLPTWGDAARIFLRVIEGVA